MDFRAGTIEIEHIFSLYNFVTRLKKSTLVEHPLLSITVRINLRIKLLHQRKLRGRSVAASEQDRSEAQI